MIGNQLFWTPIIVGVAYFGLKRLYRPPEEDTRGPWERYYDDLKGPQKPEKSLVGMGAKQASNSTPSADAAKRRKRRT